MTRALIALLGKELHQHSVAIAVGGVFFACIVVSQVGILLDENAPTLMQAAGNSVLVGIPPLVLFLSERLVTQERRSGTHAFLDALPLPAMLRTAVPWGLGFVVTMSLTAAAVFGTAQIAVLREGVPTPWLHQIHLQCQLYAAASLGMAFAVAQLGTLRILTWWLFLAGVAALGSGGLRVWLDQLWTGVLVAPLDTGRAHPDWDAMAVAAAWALGSTLVGLFLASWRGGAIPRRLSQPLSARGFGMQVVAALVVPAMFDVAIEARPPDSPQTWFGVPRVPVAGVDLRVAGDDGQLWQIGHDAAADLSQLRQRTGIGPLRPVVLVPGPALDMQTVRVAPATEEAGGLVLMVDTAGSRNDVVRRVVHRALVHHTGNRADWNPHLGWLLRGTPAWLRPDPLIAARASRGHGALDVLPDWLAVELAVGEDVAEAVAWVALEALGPEAVAVLLADALAEPIERFDLFTAYRAAPIGADWVAERTGRDLATSWRDALSHGLTPSETTYALTLGDSDGSLVLRWDGSLPFGAMARWRTLDPMSSEPLPSNRIRVIERLDIEEAAVVLPVDPNQRVAAEIIWFDPTILGFRTTGWGARW